MDDSVYVLLVEDNPDDANLTIRTLKTNNKLKVVHVKDGVEAISFIFCSGAYSDRNINDKPKVILLDLHMPKVGGMEVLAKLKSDERTKQIPVVVLTSSNEDPHIKECYDLGANSYIVKPVDLENFTKTVTKLGLYWLSVNNAP